MVDRAVDAVGYQASSTSGEKEQPNIVLEQLIQVTRPCGGLGTYLLRRVLNRYANSIKQVFPGSTCPLILVRPTRPPARDS